jgi:hypothetical protein
MRKKTMDFFEKGEKKMAEDKKNVNEEVIDDEDDIEDGTSPENNEDGYQSNNSGNNDDSKNEESKESSKGKTFTQKQVKAMMTREKKQGRNSVFNELGINPKDAKQVAMVKAFLESQKTDEDKQAEKEQAEFEKDKALAVAEAKVEIMKQGVKPQYVDDAVSLVMSKLDDDNDVASVLGSFKAKYPIWFEPEKKDDKQNVGKRGTGNSVNVDKKGSSGNDNKTLGARLAAQRRGSSKKSSYWK